MQKPTVVYMSHITYDDRNAARGPGIKSNKPLVPLVNSKTILYCYSHYVPKIENYYTLTNYCLTWSICLFYCRYVGSWRGSVLFEQRNFVTIYSHCIIVNMVMFPLYQTHRENT